ncbi:ribokinase [Clostridium sp. SYSU_GA19001]|uniref:ribokinase n=1 Tax=Clostridium caldaquaticum TaxID=2940653 RepID=UPI002076DC11|nr:ribokinase [Clostridium caldaquaticum]MCM8710008.1 ribokinase [Clostridium caldaquaticum]
MINKTNILVIGSINMDMVLQTKYVPKEGESTLGKEINYIPGGKGANQAVAVSRLDANVTLVGRVGTDNWGDMLINNLTENKVDISGVFKDEESATGIAVILLEENGANRIIVYPGANSGVSFEDIDRLLNKGCKYDAVLLQLEIPLDTVCYIIEKARKLNIPVILDAGPAQVIPLDKFKGVTIISPNETEAEKLTGIEINNIEDIVKASEIILKETEAKYVVMKLGERGSLIRDNSGYKFIKAFKVSPVDTTAAGDSFTAALTIKYCQGNSIEEAVTYASAVGAITATRFGAQPSLPYHYEVIDFLKGVR